MAKISPKVTVKTTYDFRTAEILQAQFAQLGSTTVEVGVMTNDPETLLKAHVNEYGANIPISNKMRGMMWRMGYQTAKKSIRIPSRSFLRSTYKEQTNVMKHKMAAYLRYVYSGKRTSEETLALIGDYLVKMIQNKFDKKDPSWAPNSDWTNAIKGRENDMLVFTGALRQSIGFRLVESPTAGQVKKWSKVGAPVKGKYQKIYGPHKKPGRKPGPKYKGYKASSVVKRSIDNQMTARKAWLDQANNTFKNLQKKNPTEAAEFARLWTSATEGSMVRIGKRTYTSEQSKEIIKLKHGLETEAPTIFENTATKRGRPRIHEEGYRYKPVTYDRRKDPGVIEARTKKRKATAAAKMIEQALLDEAKAEKMWKGSRSFKKGKK